MTDEEEQSEEDGDKENTPTTQGADSKQIVRVLALTAGVGVAAIIFVFLFSQLFLPFVVLFEGGGDNYAVSCSLAENHNEHMKLSWLKSDNISSYEDISEEQKENLSAESERWLNTSSLNYTDSYVREYNPVGYNQLSEEEKDVFHNGAHFDGSDWYRNSSFGTESEKILYQEDIYHCTLSYRE